MARYIYPAVFTEDPSGGYTVDFPDLDGCYTQGDDLQNAMDMAADVLCLMLYDAEQEKRSIPKASDIKDISVDEGSFVNLISVDTIAYQKFYNNKAVKKTLSIPSWLNEMAISEDINFSEVLQTGLKQVLQDRNRI
ncbi:MAG: type II toxin-antitoxin system HicB family antitoxin [Anaerofustis sp.]